MACPYVLPNFSLYVPAVKVCSIKSLLRELCYGAKTLKSSYYSSVLGIHTACTPLFNDAIKWPFQ